VTAGVGEGRFRVGRYPDFAAIGRREPGLGQPEHGLASVLRRVAAGVGWICVGFSTRENAGLSRVPHFSLALPYSPDGAAGSGNAEIRCRCRIQPASVDTVQHLRRASWHGVALKGDIRVHHKG
jgi:hypothetical protein